MTADHPARAPRRSGPGDLVRSNVAVAFGTGLSRLTGFARIIVIALVLGQGALTDAFNFANNTPNAVYELLLGGVLTASLVPMFVDANEREDREGVDALVSVAVLALLALTVIAVLAAPLLVDLLTLRVDQDQAAIRSVGTRLARLFLPQIFFYGVIALASAMLNARRRFAAAAFAPVLNNLVVIAMVLTLPLIINGHRDLALAQHSTALVWLLGLGTTAGIVVNAVAMMRALRRAGIHLRWNPQFGHPAVRRVLRMSGWTFGYVVANQVAYLFITALALGSGRGHLSAYVNAFTFFSLPHGLLAVSLMTTFAPELATAWNRGDTNRFRRQMHLGIRALGLLVLPASAGYVVLGRPLIDAALRRNEVSGADAALTGRVLMAFAVGLFGFSLYLFVLRGFYAMRDARTPFILNVGENAVNVILAIGFVDRWGVVGLAASYAIAYTSSALLAYLVLLRRLRTMHTGTLTVTLGRYLLAAITMAAVLAVSVRRIDNAVVATLSGTVVGLVVYLAVVFLSAPLDRTIVRRAA